MKFGFVTLFPEMIEQALCHSILKRAQEAGYLSVQTSNPRDFATDPRKTVDDKPFAGGPGMLMMAPQVDAALQRLEPMPEAAVIVPDPTGVLFTQNLAQELSATPQAIWVCGHYEGIDERFVALRATHRVSLGDFVLTGGELPALVMADAVARLIPGVLGDAGSLTIDSHADGLLSAPQFTRPEVWEGLAVPEVLRSGDHGAIAKWKRREALRATRDRRPDLFARAMLEKGDADMLD